MLIDLDRYFTGTAQKTARFLTIPLEVWMEWWSWNTVMHDVFGLPAIEYWFQALALGVLLAMIGKRYLFVTLDKP